MSQSGYSGKEMADIMEEQHWDEVYSEAIRMIEGSANRLPTMDHLWSMWREIQALKRELKMARGEL